MTALLEGKVALVTAASSEIGRATALVMAREGASVVLSDIDSDGVEEVLDSIRKISADGIAVPFGIVGDDGARALIARAVETYGRLDCACNHSTSSGRTGGRLHEGPEDAWERLIEVDLSRIWLGLKHETAHMLQQGSGAIVNVAAGTRPVGSSGMSVLAARAHAIVGLTKSAALDYAAKGIRINAVCPGVDGTPEAQGRAVDRGPDEKATTRSRGPLGCAGSPTEIAEAVTWLCSDRASLITGLAMGLDRHFTVP